MRVVLQRVSRAKVTVGDEITGEIDCGLLALVGIADGDTDDDLRRMADKITNLRIFEDDKNHMNRSLLDAGGAILAISQFTLFADCRRGRRPSFLGAARPEVASAMFDQFCDLLRACGVRVETGVFQAMMEVELVNSGPVTIAIDSEDLKAPRG